MHPQSTKVLSSNPCSTTDGAFTTSQPLSDSPPCLIHFPVSHLKRTTCTYLPHHFVLFLAHYHFHHPTLWKWFFKHTRGSPKCHILMTHHYWSYIRCCWLWVSAPSLLLLWIWWPISRGPSTSLPIPLGVDDLCGFFFIPLVSLSSAGVTSGRLWTSSPICLHTDDAKNLSPRLHSGFHIDVWLQGSQSDALDEPGLGTAKVCVSES